MNYKQAVTAFKTKFSDVWLNLIKVANLKPQNAWDIWLDSDGKGLKVKKDKLVTCSVKSSNLPDDIFYYTEINQIFKQGKFVIFTNLNCLSAWILGHDSYLRVYEYKDAWVKKNIFDYKIDTITSVAEIIYDPFSAQLNDNFYFFNLPLQKNDIDTLYIETQNQGFLCCL